MFLTKVEGFDQNRADEVPSYAAAFTYAVQNLLMFYSFQHLDFITYHLLNQTKLLFTALFVYLLMGTPRVATSFPSFRTPLYIPLFKARSYGRLLSLMVRVTCRAPPEQDAGSGPHHACVRGRAPWR